MSCPVAMYVVQTGGAVGMASLACFPSDPQMAEALVEAFAERRLLIRAQVDMGGCCSVKVPLGLVTTWVVCAVPRSNSMRQALPCAHQIPPGTTSADYWYM